MIEGMGFLMVKKIKILGFWMDSAGEKLQDNFKIAADKILRQIGHWSQFNISLIGRISISKTYLISQLTYIGAVLSPDAAVATRIQNLVDEYVLKRMPIAKDRLYTKPEFGGLGLINITDLMISLKCSWFKRIANDGVNDCWRAAIMKECYFNPICFRPDQLDPNNRLMSVIGMSFWTFLLTFWKTNHNFPKAPLLGNPVFNRGIGFNGKVDSRLLDSQVIGRDSYTVHSTPKNG